MLLAVAWAAFAAGAFFVAVPVTPFLIVPMTVLLAAGGAAAAAVLFLTTVPVLPSLDSLMALTLRVARDVAPAREAGAVAAAPFLAFVDAAVGAAAELAVEAAAVFRVEAAARVDRAFSTMLLNIPLLLVGGLVGDTGRAINDRLGEGGAAARSRAGRTRLLEEAGDSTWDG